MYMKLYVTRKLENCTFHIKHSIVPINFILLKLFAAKVEDGRTDNLLHQKYKFELYDGNIDGKLWSVVRNLCFPYKKNIEHTIKHSMPMAWCLLSRQGKWLDLLKGNQERYWVLFCLEYSLFQGMLLLNRKI